MHLPAQDTRLPRIYQTDCGEHETRWCEERKPCTRRLEMEVLIEKGGAPNMRAAGLGMGPTVDTYRHTTSGKEVTRANSRAVARIYKVQGKLQSTTKSEGGSRISYGSGCWISREMI